MGAFLEQIQAELVKTLQQFHALGQELKSVNPKAKFLNTDRSAKDNNIGELRPANRQLVDAVSSNGGGDKLDSIKLIDMKVMNPKIFDGKPESRFKAWANKVRACCNASRTGSRKFLK